MLRIGMLVLLGACAAGCSSAPQGPMAGASGPMASATAHGPTVAFDSIDGPPESIFNRLVQDLGDEAAARQVAVVSRRGPAQYRVRGYLAALVEGKRRATVISWVWDVYDANQQRIVRISGEEPGGGSGRGTWAAADDGVLHRIATTSMDRLAGFLAAPDVAPPGGPAAPATPGPNVAANDAPASAAFAYAGEHR
ncbi:MAG TPA: hypothetical protein VKX28_32265 [Xanthobacteraceae bacterium]|nr:hypothetical protein [Xanthobacteraceae bacterium]